MQDMPGGQEAASWLAAQVEAGGDNLQLVVDPTQKTYGRYLGALFSGGENLNLSMVRQGMVSSLEFGSPSKDVVSRTQFSQAGFEAEYSGAGIWSMPYYQRFKVYAESAGRDPTFNMLTSGIALAENPNLLALSMSMHGLPGFANPDMLDYLGQGNRIPADDDSYNTIEGMRHGGLAGLLRRTITDFGSGLRSFINSGKIAAENLQGLLSHAESWFKSKGGKYAASGPHGNMPATTFPSTIFKGTDDAVTQQLNKWRGAFKGHALEKEAQFLIDELSANLPKLKDIFNLHEIYEVYHGRRIIGTMPINAKASTFKEAFGSHISRAVIADEALTAKLAGPEHFRLMKNYRLIEGFFTEGLVQDAKATIANVGTPRSAAGELLTSHAKETIYLYKGYADRVNRIYGRVDELWDSKLSKKFIKGDKIHAMSQGRMSGAITRSMTDFEPGSSWLGPLISGKLALRSLSSFTEHAIAQAKKAGTLIKETPFAGTSGPMAEVMPAIMRSKQSFTLTKSAYLGKGTSDIEQIFKAHELSEIHHMTRQYTTAGRRNIGILQAGPVTNESAKAFYAAIRPTSFGGHASSAVIADEALLARRYGKDVFEQMRVFREKEIAESFSTYANRVPTSDVGKQWAKEEADYAKKVRRIYSRVDELWETKLSKKFGIPTQPNRIQSNVEGNTIEALQHGGQAEVMRRGLDIPVGSGWTGDVNWTLPYQLSLSQDRLGPYFRDHALDLAGTISKSTTDISYFARAGISMSVYNTGVPDVMQVPVYPPDMDANSYSNWSGIGLRGAPEGLQHGGYSGDMRAYNTGFGSGWKGIDATLSASTDFGGVHSKASGTPSISSNINYYNTSGYNYPPVQVTVQGVSPSRPGVDHNLRQLQIRNENRKVMDQVRKMGMAQMQVQTSANMFIAARSGGHKHATKGR
jgi:hypothetical protein